MLEFLKIYLNISDSSKNSLLTQLLDEATTEFEDITHSVFDLSNNSMKNIVIQMAIIKYNRLGTQGLENQSYSGASENYINDYPADLKRRIARFKKLVTA